MLNKKKILVAASIAGLMASSVAMAGSAFPGHDSGKKSMCCSMNGCKGKASCKGEKNSCKGEKNSCSGHKNGCKSQCNFSGAKAAAKVEDGKLTS